MATVKIKFRVSSIETKAGTLYYQVIHNRLVKQVHFGYKLYPSEWDADCSRVILSSGIEKGISALYEDRFGERSFPFQGGHRAA